MKMTRTIMRSKDAQCDSLESPGAASHRCEVAAFFAGYLWRDKFARASCQVPVSRAYLINILCRNCADRNEAIVRKFHEVRKFRVGNLSDRSGERRHYTFLSRVVMTLS